jgi:CheY-like chemotaxis protein
VKILAVDTSPDTCAVYVAFWTHLGHEVRTAGSASEAFEILETYTPQLVTVNYCLLGMDVGDFIRVLRHSPRFTSARIYVISGGGDFRKCQEAGADYFFLKPIGTEQLPWLPERGNDEDFRADNCPSIARYFSSGEREVDVSAEEIERWRQEFGPVPTGRFTSEGAIARQPELVESEVVILFAYHKWDEDQIVIMEKLLEPHGFRFLRAQSVADLMNVYQEHREEIDLIVINSCTLRERGSASATEPELLSGPEILDILSATEPGARCAFISGAPDKDGWMKHGAVGVLRKPCDIDEVRRALREWSLR